VLQLPAAAGVRGARLRHAAPALNPLPYPVSPCFNYMPEYAVRTRAVQPPLTCPTLPYFHPSNGTESETFYNVGRVD